MKNLHISNELKGIIGRTQEAEFAFRRASELSGAESDQMRTQGKEALQDILGFVQELIQQVG